MSRKPRFKLQRRNSGDVDDKALHGNKRWINIWGWPVFGSPGKGFRLTFEEATEQYHEVTENWPTETYRIMEKR